MGSDWLTWHVRDVGTGADTGDMSSGPSSPGRPGGRTDACTPRRSASARYPADRLGFGGESDVTLPAIKGSPDRDVIHLEVTSFTESGAPSASSLNPAAMREELQKMFTAEATPQTVTPQTVESVRTVVVLFAATSVTFWKALLKIVLTLAAVTVVILLTSGLILISRASTRSPGSAACRPAPYGYADRQDGPGQRGARPSARTPELRTPTSVARASDARRSPVRRSPVRRRAGRCRPPGSW